MTTYKIAECEDQGKKMNLILMPPDFEKKTLEDYLRTRVSDGYRYAEQHSCFSNKEKQPVFLFNVTPIDISSTDIRRFIHQGDSIRQMVPNIVEEFIKRKGLYL